MVARSQQEAAGLLALGFLTQHNRALLSGLLNPQVAIPHRLNTIAKALDALKGTGFHEPGHVELSPCTHDPSEHRFYGWQRLNIPVDTEDAEQGDDQIMIPLIRGPQHAIETVPLCLSQVLATDSRRIRQQPDKRTVNLLPLSTVPKVQQFDQSPDGAGIPDSIQLCSAKRLDMNSSRLNAKSGDKREHKPNGPVDRPLQGKHKPEEAENVYSRTERL